MKIGSQLLVMSAVFAAIPRLAIAAPGASIVVEAYDGARPADAAELLAPIHAELSKRGHLDGAALVAEIASRVSRDGGALTASQVVEAQRDVDDSYQRFVDGDYPRAITSARAALDLYASAPGQLAREPALRELRYKALVVAARSSEVNGAGEDAFALMAEAIRSFPDRTINGAQFDPSVNALFRRVKAELQRQGSGTLDIKVDDPAATIFVDEQFVASGTAHVDHVAPGRYRVYIAEAQQPGRVREIDVAPGAAATVAVSWQLEGALRTTADSVSIVLDQRASSEAEIDLATSLARTLGAHTVVVLSVRAISGRRAIAGYAISVESQNKIFAAVQVEPILPTNETLTRLAALLAGDKSVGATGLITEEPGLARVDDSTSSGLGARRTISLVVGGLAIASLAGAVGFELSSRSTYDQSKLERDDATQNSLYESANRKYKEAQGLAIGGAALAVGATILWFTVAGRAEDERGLSAIATPTTDGFSFTVCGEF